jgi:zinc protease
MISTWLAGTRSSRLEELLVQPGLALDVSAGAAASIGPGLFSVRATLCEGVEPGRVRELVSGEIGRLAASGLPDTAMEEIRRQHRALKTLSTASPAGIAGEICMGAALFRDPQHHNWLMSQVEKASAEDLSRVCSEWLTPGREVAAELVPAGQQPSAVASSPIGGHGDIRAPQPGDLSSVEVPASMLAGPDRSISRGAVDTRLDNGLRVLMLRDDTFPVVSIAFSTGTCSGREPRSSAGLAAVAVEALHYGTDSEEYQAFNRRLESLGADLSVSAGVEYASGATFVLSGDVPEALSVISDLLTAPAFRDADVGKVVADRLVELQQKRESPFGLALDNLARLMSEPEEAARVPDETSLGSIDAKLARSFHLSCSRPSSSIIAVAGSFDREAVLEMAGRRFGSWRDPSDPLPELELPVIPARPDSRRLSMDGRHQTAIVLGWAAPGRSHPDHAAFELVNVALGDGIGSRLGTSIREQQGLAYQIGSEYLASAGRGRMVVYLATAGATAGKALASVMSVVAELGSSGLSPRELELAKASMRCRHDLSMMDYESIAAYLMRCASSGRPLDYDLLKTRALMSVGVGETLEVARRWLSSEPFVSMAGAVI